MTTTFSAVQAAKVTGVSRTTIMRKLAANEFPQATKDDDGWHIPVGDLLAAGLNPGRQAPPEDHVRSPAPFTVLDSERQVMELTHEVELLRVQLAAAQQIATEKDRIASEKDRLIETQAQALRALGAAPNTQPTPVPAQKEPPAPAPVTQNRPARRGGLLGLLGL